MAKVNRFNVNYWKDERERAIKNRWYAIGRMDLLIISISGGGIYLIFQIIKHISDKQLSINYDALKVSGILFTIAIVVNFFSQLFGLKANEWDTAYCKGELNKARKLNVNEAELSTSKCWADIYSNRVEICNWISIITMGLGVSLLVAYTYIFL